MRIRYLEPVVPPFGAGLRRERVRSLEFAVRSRVVEELERLRS